MALFFSFDNCQARLRRVGRYWRENYCIYCRALILQRRRLCNLAFILPPNIEVLLFLTSLVYVLLLRTLSYTSIKSFLPKIGTPQMQEMYDNKNSKENCMGFSHNLA